MAHEVTLGPAAAEMRRRLGPVAWSALETLAEHSQPSADGECAAVSVRTVAAELGVADNTAHRALRRLVLAGLVERRQARAGHGRFAAATYRLTIGPDVLRASIEATTPAAPPVQPPKPPRPRQLTPVVEQLVLLPTLRQSHVRDDLSRGSPKFVQTSAHERAGRSRADAAGDDPPRVVGGGDGDVLRAST